MRKGTQQGAIDEAAARTHGGAAFLAAAWGHFLRRCIFEEESCVAAGPRRTCREGEGELRTSQAFQLLSWPGCVVSSGAAARG